MRLLFIFMWKAVFILYFAQAQQAGSLKNGLIRLACANLIRAKLIKKA